jgi:hypothetical protein
MQRLTLLRCEVSRAHRIYLNKRAYRHARTWIDAKSMRHSSSLLEAGLGSSRVTGRLLVSNHLR